MGLFLVLIQIFFVLKCLAVLSFRFFVLAKRKAQGISFDISEHFREARAEKICSKPYVAL